MSSHHYLCIPIHDFFLSTRLGRGILAQVMTQRLIVFPLSVLSYFHLPLKNHTRLTGYPYHVSSTSRRTSIRAIATTVLLPLQHESDRPGVGIRRLLLREIHVLVNCGTLESYYHLLPVLHFHASDGQRRNRKP